MSPTPLPYIIVERGQETPTVFSLRLQPKTGSVFTFTPGQFLMLHLNATTHPDSKRPRAYSISSLPNKYYLTVTIKVRGDYTAALSCLKIGEELGIAGPFGTFTIPDNHQGPLVLIAAGCGIAPFRPMILSNLVSYPDAPITLLYSTTSQEEIIFEKDWQELASQFPCFSPIITLTENTTPNWQGETGRINTEMIKRHVSNLKKPLYFLCGSLEFVDTIKNALLNLGVKDRNIKKEGF